MMENDLRAAERRTFRAAADVGLWDVLIAAFLSVFAIAPLLSARLGDFWSSAIFVPVIGAAWALIWLVRQRLVIPRIGVVRFASSRQARLRRLTVALLVVNILAFLLGAFLALRFEPGPRSGLAPTIMLSATLLVGFSLAAYSLDIPRYFLYGLFLAAAPFVGEQLFRAGHASHHGYPVVFGTAAALIAAVGLITLWLRVRGHGPGAEGA